MALTAVINRINSSRELRRGDCAMFNIIGWTPGTGRRDEHTHVWSIESSPVGYEMSVNLPDYADPTDATIGTVFAPGGSIDLVTSSLKHTGSTFALTNLIEGSYTVRVTSYDKDGSTSDFAEASFSVLAVGSLATAETLVEIRADGTGDYTTLDAAAKALLDNNVTTYVNNFRFEISEAGTYQFWETDVSVNSLQIVNTSGGEVIIDAGLASSALYGGFRFSTFGGAKVYENIVLQGLTLKNSGTTLAKGNGEFVFARISQSFSGLFLVDCQAVNDTDGDVGSLVTYSNTKAANTDDDHLAIVNCSSEGKCVNYSCVGYFANVEETSSCCVLGGRFDATTGERVFRTDVSNSSIGFTRMDWTGGNSAKEPLRYMLGDDHTVSNSAILGGILLGNGTGNTPQSVRVEGCVVSQLEFARGVIVDQSQSGGGGITVWGSVLINQFDGTPNNAMYTAGNMAKTSILHSTFIMKATTGGAGFITNGNVNDVYVENCLFINSTAQTIDAFKNTNASGTFTSTNNIWPATDDLNATPFAIASVNEDSVDWLADANVTGDTFVTKTVTDAGLIDTDLTAVTIADGGIYDLYQGETTPGASGFVGAVQSVPSAPSGPRPVSSGAWGLRASRMDIPKFIQKDFQNSAVLTRRGWEQRLPGSNPDKGLMEVVVAGNFGIPAGDNEAPYFFEGVNPLSRTLTGVVGSPIKPYIIEIVDPDKVLEGDAVSVASSTGLPTGLSVVKMSLNSPLEIFAITGTPSGSGSDQLTINFTDGDATITAVIDYNIQG